MSGPLLLDTHAYVWALSAPHKLSARARAAVLRPDRPLYVSAASVWEMGIKHHQGRWPEAEDLLARHDGYLKRLGASSLSITATDATRAGGLRWEHTDPFDRMLAAQAMRSEAVLVTRDAAFIDVPGLRVLW